MPETIAPEPATLIVGEFTLDLTTGELECNGVSTRLQDKPFRVLRVLAERAGELVTREQLVERLWPQGSYVEFEMGLNTAVRKLRMALGDDADAPRYIETLPRRGYRLLAAVKYSTTCASSVSQGPVDTLPNSSLEPRSHDRKSATMRRRWWIPAAAAMLVLAIAYLLVNRLWLSQRTASTAREAASVTGAARPAINEQSIAVLPFVDMSEQKDQEYFSDGLSEELIELLGKTPSLRVIARTSSFYFKGRAEKLETIGAELRVANVLEGSVRKSGDRLRVTAQLIRAETNEHIWSETFDRDLHDVFKVQDEIAGAVVMALKVHLLPKQQPAPAEELRTQNLEAYNLYLQGRQSYNQGDAAGFQRAVTAFRAATALDSHYAAAYADLALAQFWLADNTVDIGGYEAALAAAEQAVALAPGSAAGYSARGFLRAVYRFDFAGGQADLDRAIMLSPQDALVLHRSAVLLGVLGDLPAAIATEEKALALDPLSEEICRRLGFFFVANQQFAQARPLYEKALAIAPNSDRARYNLGDLELYDTRPQQALAAFRQTRIAELSLAGQAKAEYSVGRLEVSRKLLEQLIARSGQSSPGLIAHVYVWRGEKQRALEWAERAYAQRDAGITWLKIDPDFRSLRADPRYSALLRKMQLQSPPPPH